MQKEDGVVYKKTQQLQILDSKNEPQKLVDYKITTKEGDKTIKAFTMDDVENTIQRCKVKNFQQFGLGAALYQGKIKNQFNQPTEQEITSNNGTPVDIAVIEEILLNNPSKKGYTAQKIYDYCNNKNWFNEKYNKPITAQTIKYFLKKGWF